MKCEVCHQVLPEDSEFCQYCGNSIVIPKDESDTPSEAVAPASEINAPTIIKNETEKVNTPVGETDEKKKDEKPVRMNTRAPKRKVSVPFVEFVDKNSDKLNPANLTAIMMPLAITLRDKHNDGQLFLKLSPHVISVTSSGCVIRADRLNDGFVYQEFLSPEQLSSSLSGVQSDVYSFCAVLKYVATACKWSDAQDNNNTAWSAVVEKGLCENANDRYASMQELIHALSPFNTANAGEVGFDFTAHKEKATQATKSIKHPVRFGVLMGVALLVVGVMIYAGVNYSNAVRAIDNEEFISARRYLDNLIVAESLLPQQCEYVNAGVLMEKGKYIESLRAFKLIRTKNTTPVPASIINQLIAQVYLDGIDAYRTGNRSSARECFIAVDRYQNSSSYLFLLDIKDDLYIDSFDAQRLISLIGFADAEEIIMSKQDAAIEFLKGTWSDNSSGYYFSISSGSDNTSNYNLPSTNPRGYYTISNGIYSVGSTKLFKFTILNRDAVSVLCYYNMRTYNLYRR